MEPLGCTLSGPFYFPVLSSLACAAPLACKRGYLFRHRDSTNQFRILRYGVWPTQKIALDFVASFVRKKRELTINGIDWTSECRECPTWGNLVLFCQNTVRLF
jgi:hypothetical protein